MQLDGHQVKIWWKKKDVLLDVMNKQTSWAFNKHLNLQRTEILHGNLTKY